MSLTLKMVESQLNSLKRSNISYEYDNFNENNSFYEKIGSYDIFYIYLNFPEKIENIKEFLESLDTKYICFDLLNYDKLWTNGENFNPRTHKWQKVYKLNIQALFNKSKYFEHNRNEVLSSYLKSLIEQKRLPRIKKDAPKFKEFD